jgi:hypothetical protein
MRRPEKPDTAPRCASADAVAPEPIRASPGASGPTCSGCEQPTAQPDRAPLPAAQEIGRRVLAEAVRRVAAAHGFSRRRNGSQRPVEEGRA